MLSLLMLLPPAAAAPPPLMDALRRSPVDPADCQRALALAATPEDCRVQAQPHGVLVLATTGCGGDSCDGVAAVVRSDGIHALPATSGGAQLLGGTTVLLPGGRRVLTDRLRPGEAPGTWQVDTALVDVDSESVRDFLDCFSVALGPDGQTLTCRDREGALLRSSTEAGLLHEVWPGTGPRVGPVDWAPYKWVMPEAAAWIDPETVRFTVVRPGGEPVETRAATVSSVPQPDGMDGWVEVATVFPGHIRLEGAVFVRTKQGCLPAEVAGDDLHVELCSTPTATCTWTHAATGAWSPSESFSCERPDGSGWGGGAGGSHHDLPRIVRDDAAGIEWAVAPQLEAWPASQRVDERPCTAESAAAGTEYGRGPARRCHVSTGYGIAPRRRFGGMGMGIAWAPTPVDCRSPCPADPDGDRIAAASSWLAGRRFVAEDAPRIGIYVAIQDCEDAEYEPLLSLDLDACEGGD